jgi:hypothetical protein
MSKKSPDWSEEEIAILKENYPKHGGIDKCVTLLPNRTRVAISGKSKYFKLYTIRDSVKEFSHRYNESEDNIIIQTYTSSSHKRGFLKELCKSLNKDMQWVRRRAQQLGVYKPVPAVWTDKELEILNRYSESTVNTIYLRLKAAGFNKTHASIVHKRQRLELDTESVDEWSVEQLTKLTGHNRVTIDKWIEKEGLKFKKVIPITNLQNREFRVITKKYFLDWLKEHPQCVDLKRVDKFWFLDTILN